MDRKVDFTALEPIDMGHSDCAVCEAAKRAEPAVYPNKDFCWYCGFSFGVFYDYGSELWVCQDCFREQIRDVYGSAEEPDDTKNESRDIAKVDTTKELDTPR